MRTTLALPIFLPFLACSTPPEAVSTAPAAPASSPPTSSGPKRAFELADVYRVKQVGSPALSPDGRRVAFQVRRTDLVADEAWCEIWLMDADGKNARQMTRGKNQDTSPQFTPDGASLLFSSNRAGATQLY